MTYLQLSLYGIPAVVYCGNTLTQEMRFKMETPLYFMQYWKFRNFHTCSEEEKSKENKQKVIIEKPIKIQNLFKEVTVKGNTQIALW